MNNLIKDLCGQAKRRIVDLGGITITSGSEDAEPYSDKKKNIEVAQTELGKIHADFIKNGVLSHQEEIKKEAAFKAENERMYNEIKKLGEVHARVYKENDLVGNIVDELEEMNKRIAALEGQAQKQLKEFNHTEFAKNAEHYVSKINKSEDFKINPKK